MAGAGSGKTLTIVGKIKYLVDILGVSAEQILPISFTHKSAEEMKHRIGVPGVEPQTFHKFGLNVIRQVQGSVGIVSEANDEVIFRRFLQEMIDTDPQFLDRLNNFLLYYFKIPKSQFEFKTLGDYIQYLKDQNFTTLKQIAKKYTQKQQSRQTLKNEIVKSIEECQIANFLTLNRVEYQYEQLYRPSLGSSQSTKQQTPFQGNYKPDFTIITDEGKVIYLEHFGMDKQGNVPSFFARPGETRAQAAARYQSSYRWKKKIHHQYQTDMIETYSHQFDDGVLFEHLQQELTRLGVKLKPLTPFEKWQLIQKTSADQVDALISLIKTFLALLKSNNYTIDQIKKINQQKKQLGFLRKRADLFLDLFVPIYTKYQDQLRELNAIDFSDMINQAAHYIATGQYSCSCPFRYVIVDEFQDLSFGRYQILQAIRQQNPNVKFYCVGDDWQSIFRFTGSDITLFSQFERYFGVTALSRIETTYRFNQPLIGLSSDFILKNPHQLAKKLIAPAGKESTTYKIVESLADDDTEAVIQVVKQLLDNGAKPEESFYLIGRYNFDFQRRIMGRNHRHIKQPSFFAVSELITTT